MNYHVVDKESVYYNEVPNILQIGKHQFVETYLINMWISMMLFSWMSATNCARIYNTFSSSGIPPVVWQFNLSVTPSQVFNSFTLLSLLEDCQTQNTILISTLLSPTRSDQILSSSDQNQYKFRKNLHFNFI